jgi:hypothetical protein
LIVVLAGIVPVTAVDSVMTAVVGWNGGASLPPPPPLQAVSIARLRANIIKIDKDIFFIL